MEECYSKFGGNYKDAMNRMYSEERVIRYAFNFLDTTDDEMLEKAHDEKDNSKMFVFSHRIKGMAANLGFSDLQKSASQLTEMYRGGKIPDTSDSDKVYSEVESEYKKIKENITDFKNA